MLVIAPLRVCRTVWRQEGAKWSHLRHLRFSLLHGKKKFEALKTDADVYLINPEGVEWLCHQFFGRPLPFDVVTVDELTKFKNHQSDRSKALRPRTERTRWIWGLTGSLLPNYYMGLFGQQLLLDHGAALGKYITHFRDQYFQLDYDGFTYNLLPGAERRITERLAPYWFYMDESDYAQLPPLIPNPIMLDLDKSARTHYEKMKRDLITQLPGGVVTAANAAASYSKLAQMANGAVYLLDHKVEHIHDLKLDALEDLVDELAGEPLLVGYEFNHDLARLRERFGKDLPVLGEGTTAAQETRYIADWNARKLPILACHPASAGHGLNLQEGNACNLAWFGITWDYELYDQFIRRIRRDGNQARQIFEHRLIVRGTIDELKLEALSDKDATQTRFLRALNQEILREGAEAHATGETVVLDDRRLPLVAPRLPRQAESAATAPAAPPRNLPAGWAAQPAAEPHHPPAAAQEPARATPKGWGPPQTEAAQVDNGQQQRIQDQINPGPGNAAMSAFSAETQNAHAAALAFDPNAQTPAAQAALAPATQAPPATGGRRKKATATEAPVASGDDIVQAAIINARARVLEVAFSDPATDIDGGLELARELMQFVLEG